MVRILFFIVLILALGFGFSWLADRPGELFILWQGQRIEMTLMVAATIVAALVFVVMFLWWVVRTIWTSPQSMTRYFRARKRDRGYQALSTGLIAVGSGDAPLARKMLDRTKGLISSDSEPLIHLLEAQASLIEGKSEDARKKFEAMAEDPETRELGLRGLYLEALRLGAHEAARHYAERAVEKAPHLPWAAEATLDYRTQAGRYDDAIRLLETQRVLGGMDRKVHDRKKAVLLTGRALSKLEGDPRAARDDALHGLKLAPDLVPAATIAAKAYLREQNTKKALSTLEQVWKLGPHMEVASAYLAAGGASAQEKLKRAERLEQLQPGKFESLYAVASAALDARDFTLARGQAELAARVEERESIYLLMADIEEADGDDQGRVRHWLAQALRASRDPEWVADGQVSTHWLPVSPVTGRLDAFEWKQAFGPSAGALEDASVNRAEQAFRSLPAPRAVEQITVPQDEVTRPADISSTEPAAIPIVIEKIAERNEQKPTVQSVASTETAVMDTLFFGRPPDDPGVKLNKPVEKTGFRLF